jgi:3-deoxy-D-manno-octulosonate 8-phosphate phosphatase (KDO 8-P phosphatase)
MNPPVRRFSPELLLLAQGLGSGMRAAFIDVDGVLTDGRLFIGEAGEGFKAFHVLDGHGLKLLAMAGIEPVVITGRDSPSVRRRMADLGVREAHYGVADKLVVAQAWLDAKACSWAEVAAMGDDWPDLPLLTRAGFACAPPNAHPEVLSRVHHVTAAAGGAGAAREFSDILLMASGHYHPMLAAALHDQRQTLDKR